MAYYHVLYSPYKVSCVTCIRTNRVCFGLIDFFALHSYSFIISVVVAVVLVLQHTRRQFSSVMTVPMTYNINQLPSVGRRRAASRGTVLGTIIWWHRYRREISTNGEYDGKQKMWRVAAWCFLNDGDDDDKRG